MKFAHGDKVRFIKPYPTDPEHVHVGKVVALPGEVFEGAKDPNGSSLDWFRGSALSDYIIERPNGSHWFCHEESLVPWDEGGGRSMRKKTLLGIAAFVACVAIAYWLLGFVVG